MLRDTRAGLDHIAFHKVDLRAGTAAIAVTSLGFADHAPLPEKYTADGVGVSPSLAWSPLPVGTHSVLVIVEDADAPTPHPWVHAIVVGLRPDETALAEAAMPSADNDGTRLHVGLNSFLQAAWLPPDPPPGHGIHRYCFQVFALDAVVDFEPRPGREAVLDALAQHGLASGCLIGTYERPDTSIRSDDRIAANPPEPGPVEAIPLAS
ncbi:MAG: YbhB/YbcL family Raf kinase inhibitor-like protein [Burkholderiaceae bacterium]